MKEKTKVEVEQKTRKGSLQMSRRGLIQKGAAAALFLGVGTTAPGAGQSGPSATPLTNYGKGNSALTPENIFPLFAAWLLFTTDGNFTVDEEMLTCAARIHPDSAKKLITIFNKKAAQFKPVRDLFHDIAINFSAGEAPYSGGQCPTYPDTVTPVAALLGTHTTVACKSSTKTAKPAKP